MDDGYQVRLGKPEDAEAIWDLYQRTGFLYPEKLAAMGDGGGQARKTFQRLLELRSPLYRVAVTTDSAGTIQAAVTYGQTLASQVWLMHMASAHNLKALNLSFLQAGNGAIASSAHWSIFSFRESNTRIKNLFLSIQAELQDPLELQGYDYYVVAPEAARKMTLLETSESTRPGGDEDRLSLLQVVKQNSAEWAALEANGPLNPEVALNGARDLFNQAGLPRDRAAFAVGPESSPTAIAILDLSPPWWNLSNLSTGLRIWYAVPAPSPEAITALLKASAEWFAERATDHWTILVPPSQPELTALLESVGLRSTKRYVRIGAPLTLGPRIARSYLRYIRGSRTVPGLIDSPRMASSVEGQI